MINQGNRQAGGKRETAEDGEARLKGAAQIAQMAEERAPNTAREDLA